MYDSNQCAQCLHAEHTRQKGHLCPVFNAFWIFHNTDSGEKKDYNSSTIFVEPWYITDTKKI